MMWHIEAGVAELVDAKVSKTFSFQECRFESDHPHHFQNPTSIHPLVDCCILKSTGGDPLRNPRMD